MRNFYPACILLLGSLFFGCGAAPESRPEQKLWYRQPAAAWTEALPVGNGRLGAMVFGQPLHETIQFNEESLWAGSQINSNNPAALENLDEVRRLIFAGKLTEANTLASETMLGTPPRIRSYQPLGDLSIDYPAGDTADYRRELDLRTGVSTSEFEIDGVRYIQEVFASAPDDLLVVRLRASKKGALGVSLRLSREKDARTTATADGLLMEGQIIDADAPLTGLGGEHMRFAARMQVSTRGGQVSADTEGLRIEGADEALLLLTGATDYNLSLLDCDRTIDPDGRCAAILEKAQGKKYEKLLSGHLEEYKTLFDRVSLDLGDNPAQSALPTDQRLQGLKDGADDPGLIALYFQYGRYLLMGSSRAPGILPANLQGIWNRELKAPWNSDFHTNINLQMNYWPAQVCNLPETMLPLIGFMDRLQEPGSVTARETYGAGGWTLHHLTDPFGRTAVMDGIWGCYPMGGPWMAFQLYEQYAFMGDTALLRGTIWPLMKSSARFVLDFLVKGPGGQWVTAPSNSPENSFVDPVTGEHARMTYAATMDIQIITELLRHCISASEVLQTDALFADSLRSVLAGMPPVKISSRTGGIQEWIEDYEEVEPGHRHISHLLGLHPGSQITPETPELFEAARKTIDHRLAFGGGHTGWSRAWVINFYARLLDGENAHYHMVELLRRSTFINLFDNHPPFQIDGNFGGTAGVAEMLLQSHAGTLHILPALPAAWPTGQVKGLLARGGFETDIRWQDGVLREVTVTSHQGNPLVLQYGEKIRSMETEKGGVYRIDKFE